MKPILAPFTILAAPFLAVLSAQPLTNSKPSAVIELRIETLANREAEPAAPCESVQAANGTRFVSWSTVGLARPSEKGGIALIDAVSRCGTGALPQATASSLSGAAPNPILVQEISADAGWEPGAMDPGPQVAVQISLTITSRRLEGYARDGMPFYTTPATDFRTIRLEAGEEHIIPVLAAGSSGREATGIQEAMLRIRAGWAGRQGATEYGALTIMAAAPGSEILLDGGIAGHVGADGSYLLRNVPVGQREVRIRPVSGPMLMRIVSVAKGKTVAVMPEPVGMGFRAQPSLTPAGKNSQGFPEYRRMPDGAMMVQVPEGEFLMGNLETEGKPLPHKVNLTSSFLMDKLPVTVGRFKLFAAATGNPLPPDPYWGVHDDFPVAFVRWDEGRAYCEWAGARLPTEAEREKATRGTDGRLWPWGNEPPPTPAHGVFRRNWGELGNDAAGIRPAGASPYGLLDTGGNMWEWCEDWFDPDYFKSSPPNDPPGPKTGRARIVKGGSWDSRPTVLSASSRNFGYIGYREGDYGFRCAADPPR